MIINYYILYKKQNITDINNDDIFAKFNDHEVNPELQQFIQKNRLHISMSVGDIIKYNEKFYIVTGCGFILCL